MAVEESKGALGIPLLAGAIGFGLAAALLAFIYLSAEKKAMIEKYAGGDRRQVTLMVASKDLRKGTILTQKVITSRKVPARFAHSDAIVAKNFERYVGGVIEVNVKAGKPILRSFLDTGFPADFSDTIPVGRRAMTVQVDEVNSVAGFIRPGNRIDIYVNVTLSTSGFSASFITPESIGALPKGLLDSIPPALLDAALNASPDDPNIDALVTNALPKDVIVPVLQNVSVLATGRDPYREQLDALRYPQPR